MDRLSDYVLAILIHRCSMVGYLTHSLKTKSLRLRRYLSVNKKRGTEVSAYLASLPDSLLSNLTHLILTSDAIREDSEILLRCPSLTTLKCDVDWRPSVIRTLPPTLTKLNGMCYLSVTDLLSIDMSKLPCPIHSALSLSSNHNSIRQARLLLSSTGVSITKIHAVNLGGLEDFFQSQINIIANCRTITSLHVEELALEWMPSLNSLVNLDDLIVGVIREVSLLYAIKIPLKRLVCVVSEDVMLCQLPMSLTDLSVRSSERNGHLNIYAQAATPRLEKLWTNLHIRTQLPSSLFRLNTGYMRLKWIVECKHLVSLEYYPADTCADVHWPDSITHLTLCVRNPTEVPVSLPRRLRILRVDRMISDSKWNATNATAVGRMRNTMNRWSLSGIREVTVNYRLTEEQLASFTGTVLRHAE